MNRKVAEEHIRAHVTYPTTADEIKKACTNMQEFSPEDRSWLHEHLSPRAAVRPGRARFGLSQEVDVAGRASESRPAVQTG